MAWCVRPAAPLLAAAVLAINALALTSLTPDHVERGLDISSDPDEDAGTHASEQANGEFDAVLRRYAAAPPRSGGEGGSGQGQLIALNEIHMLVSLYLPKSPVHPHVKEMLAAFNVNLENPVIASIHVLLEAPGLTCSALPAAVKSAIGRSLTVEDMAKVKCTTVAQQPTYADFFEYANSTMSRSGTILLANADIVFDGSLRKLTRPRPRSEGHLISVRAPPYSGEFRSIFKKRCSAVLNKCTRVTKSWDAYAFSLPLSAELRDYDLGFTMNVFTADHRAAFALNQAGMALTNPCMHVNAFHFHCFSEKMHANFRDENNNTGRLVGIYMKAYPCHDFPSDRCVVEKMP